MGFKLRIFLMVGYNLLTTRMETFFETNSYNHLYLWEIDEYILDLLNNVFEFSKYFN